MIEESRAGGATTRSEEVDDDEHPGRVVQAVALAPAPTLPPRPARKQTHHAGLALSLAAAREGGCRLRGSADRRAGCAGDRGLADRALTRLPVRRHSGASAGVRTGGG